MTPQTETGRVAPLVAPVAKPSVFDMLAKGQKPTAGNDNGRTVHGTYRMDADGNMIITVPTAGLKYSDIKKNPERTDPDTGRKIGASALLVCQIASDPKATEATKLALANPGGPTIVLPVRPSLNFNVLLNIGGAEFVEPEPAA